MRDNTKDCHHKKEINSSFKIDGILVDFKCKINEDHEEYFIITIDGKTIINDEYFGYDYCMIKRDKNIINFNLKHYHKLDELSQICTKYGFVNEEKDYIDEKEDNEENEEKDYIYYDKNLEDEKGVIDLELFVEICKNKFPNNNPIEFFDMIMLCLIYCYKL